jgi:hypothetical protein
MKKTSLKGIKKEKFSILVTYHLDQILKTLMKMNQGSFHLEDTRYYYFFESLLIYLFKLFYLRIYFRITQNSVKLKFWENKVIKSHELIRLS